MAEPTPHNRAYRFTLKFLYPGVLGSIIYAVFDALLINDTFADTNPTLPIIAVLLIVFLFYSDYEHLEARVAPQDYNFKQAILDILIVISAFLAVNEVIQPAGYWGEVDWVPGDVDWVSLAFVLALKNLLGLAWEFFEGPRRRADMMWVYIAFAALFAAATFFTIPFAMVVVLIAANAFCVCWVVFFK